MDSIFISASIQDKKTTDAEKLAPIDTIAIKNALIACAEEFLPKYEIIWGGHPAISAILSLILNEHKTRDTVFYRVFQSSWFVQTDCGLNVTYTRRMGTKDDSLEHMRQEMLSSDINYVLGIFMGGKTSGLSRELELFTNNHPNAKIIFLPKTGGYAKFAFDKFYASGASCRNQSAHFMTELMQKHERAQRYYALFAEAKDQLHAISSTQVKCILGKRAGNHLLQSLQKKQIVALSELEQDYKIRPTTLADRAGERMLQLSFIITDENDNILAVDRLDEGGVRVTSGTSVLISTNPEYNGRLCNSNDAILNCLIRNFELDSGLDPLQIQFLGLIYNSVTKQGFDSPLEYLFYTFKIKLPFSQFNTLIDKAKTLRKNAYRNYRVKSLKEITDEVKEWKNRADKAALMLLSKVESRAFEADYGTAMFVDFSSSCPFEKLHNSYFISHATQDYERYVLPLCQLLAERNIPYWCHEESVLLDSDWRLSNQDKLKYCRGFISIETDAFVKSKFTQQEAIEAIRTKRKVTGYSIYRFLCPHIHDENKKAWEQSEHTELREYAALSSVTVNMEDKEQIANLLDKHFTT